MKQRNRKYLRRRKAMNQLINFNDMHSFLKACYELSGNVIVKRDILRTMFEMRRNFDTQRREAS